ncbi:hypothetical protein [Pseudomonas sp. SCB32]|uniref:hypothetical protein n=1 Tax=Pseudomonas sp. SCB32 TaxID=2653853 RepID=UPI001263FCE8|nr:hypothetical protein [Pseudomonas sp. SCB32]
MIKQAHVPKAVGFFVDTVSAWSPGCRSELAREPTRLWICREIRSRASSPLQVGLAKARCKYLIQKLKKSLEFFSKAHRISADT